MKKMLEAHLFDKIIPFWNAQVDVEHGGFYGYVGPDLQIDKKADKGAVKMARLLYSYAALFNHYKQDEYRAYAEQAYRYIHNHLLDSEQGGVYWKTTFDGQPIRTEKHVYAHSFTLYALCEYYQATEDPVVLKEAITLFELLEQHAYEPKTGTYWEQFDRTWQPMPNGLLASDTVEPVYTTNAIIHLIEALTALYRVYPDPCVHARLKGLLTWFSETVYKIDQGSCQVFFDDTWHSMVESVSYGHDIESTWLIDEAVEALGLDDEPCRLMTLKMLQICHQDGFDQGWMISERNGSTPAPEMIWWVQAEAMVGFLNGYRKTGDSVYYQAMLETVQATLQYITDPRLGGEWFWAVCKTTHQPLPERGISENWKANYHNIRALLKLIAAKEVPE